jgi:hypothetical protein
MGGSIFKKMSQVMSEIGHVGKDQKNTAQGFKFRGIDQFVNSLYPALTKHGVFMSPRCVKEVHELRTVVRGNGKEGIDKHVNILMEYDFFAEDGSKVTVGPIPAEGIDSGDKATNKALSAALKYALIQTFSIPTEDMAEGDLESPVISGYTKVESSSEKVVSAETSNVQPQVITLSTPTSTSEVVVQTGFKRTKKVKQAAAEQSSSSSSGELF